MNGFIRSIIVIAPLLSASHAIAQDRPSTTREAEITKVVGPLKLVTRLTTKDIELIVRDASDHFIDLEGVRGEVIVQSVGDAKRYRYGLRPDGKGTLRSDLGLKHQAGELIEVQLRLIGLPGDRTPRVTLQQTTTITEKVHRR